MRLTKKVVDSLTYQGVTSQRFVVWDSDPPGFGVRVYPSGRKAFVLSYRVGGRKRLLTIGAYGVLTLDQARTAARAELAKVETGAADPLEDRQREARGESVRDLCAAYMERHGNAKRSARDDARRIRQHVLPAWGGLKVKAVKRADVAALHSRIGKAGKPYEANRTLALLSKIFELARRWGYIPEDHGNPARDIDKFSEAKRDRWLTPEELPRLAQAINEEPNEAARHALWLYLLTGARKSELLRARWADVSFERAELRLPETKAGGVHYIPLSGPALALLRQIPRTDGNPYIFPGRGARGAPPEERAAAPAHLVNIDKPWQRVRKAAGVEDVRLHDLRRTVGSWLAQSGNSLHLIGRVLNHSNASTTQVYARFGEDSVRNALEQHGARIMGAAGLTPAAEVAHLPAPAAKPEDPDARTNLPPEVPSPPARLNRCGACGFWAEDYSNATSGACINRRSAFYDEPRAAKDAACTRFARDDYGNPATRAAND
ncbi:integrase [Thiohalocapsa halophila]|uniref:Integrase n=1 Tax=Thiohalocapsa halophila TaxID=69359 RepID=A0ABS1CH26_9GAMM|nr:site-specific integrase [Thiohalocapsa halophila]MBK1631203.1 integrase [Thiohalocapsa halophila]